MTKLFSRLASVMLLGLLFIGSADNKAVAQDVTVSYQDFYDNLSPYGQWVSDPQYGNVWVPNEGGDFRPYGSRGRWAMTDYGNTWVSDDPWGWAVYHYGRWTYDAYYGWVWIPGYEWAPAWVSWRYGGGNCGWAPLGPGISVGAAFNCPDSWWIFVSPTYMYSPNCYSYWRGPSYNTTYIRQTTIINNYYVDNGTRVRYNYGPRAEVIQRDTRQPVQIYRVSQMNRPGAPGISGNRVSIYRPNVDRGSRGSARPGNVMQAPRQIGRPQAATNVSPSRQAPFRQEVQKRNPEGGRNVQGNQPGNRVDNRGGVNQSQPNRSDNREPGRNNQNQPVNRYDNRTPGNREQPANRGDRSPNPSQQGNRFNRSNPGNNDQPVNRPQPRNDQPINRPEPRQQPMNRPEPQQRAEPRPQPMNRPEPRQQPMNRPEPRQQPMNRPEPRRQPMNRPQPAPQQRAMPAPQQNRPQPAPQQRQAPSGRPEMREGGRR